MRQWTVIWEIGFNRYASAQYEGMTIENVIAAWKMERPNREVRWITSVIGL